MTPQRSLGSSVVACLAGAALALYGATRVWSVQVTERPGLTSLRATTTGAAVAPWLIGLALVALAGAGALLATRGLPRRLLGGLLTIVGAGLVAAAITGRVGLDPGAAGAAATFWPIVCVLGGGLVGWGGVSAARHGHHWPSMGSRYERRPAPSSAARLAAEPARSAAAGLTGRQEPADAAPAPDQNAGPGADPPGSGIGHGPGSGSGLGSGSGSGRGSGSGPSSGSGAGPGSGSGGGSGIDPSTTAAEPASAGEVKGTADSRSAMIASVDTRAAWDALDRGDDPTVT